MEHITLQQLHKRATTISRVTNIEHYIYRGNGYHTFVIGDSLKGLVDQTIYTGATKRELLHVMQVYHEGIIMGRKCSND